MRSGAFAALGGMLGAALGLLAGLRYWFLASRWIGERESTWTPWHSIVIFWVIVVLVIFLFLKYRQEYTESFESVFPSIVDRVLGGLFGLGTGTMIAAALLMTLSLLSPTIWHGYDAAQLPLPMDRYTFQAYRYIETHVAAVAPTDHGHTPLPAIPAKSSNSPAHFWQ